MAPADRASLLAFLASDPALAALLEEARSRMARDPGHDLAHALRVALWTLRIGEEEGVPPRLAAAAALLHDLVNVPKDSPDRARAGELSATAAREILAARGFPPGEADLAAEAIRDHSFSRGAVPSSALGRALQDADRLDALGAIGVLRTASTGVLMGGGLLRPRRPLGPLEAPGRPRPQRRSLLHEAAPPPREHADGGGPPRGGAAGRLPGRLPPAARPGDRRGPAPILRPRPLPVTVVGGGGWPPVPGCRIVPRQADWGGGPAVDPGRIRELVEKYAADPVVLAVAGGGLLLVVLILVLRSARRKRAGRSEADAAARARQRLLGGLRAFRDDVVKAAAGSGPVFRKIDSETAHASVIGHWRKSLRHRITVRPVDLGAMKSAARALRLDSTPLSDLEAAWRKSARQIGEYNAGKLDDSSTPIATVRQFEKDLQKIVVLANIALKALGG